MSVWQNPRFCASMLSVHILLASGCIQLVAGLLGDGATLFESVLKGRINTIPQPSSGKISVPLSNTLYVDSYDVALQEVDAIAEPTNSSQPLVAMCSHAMYVSLDVCGCS